MDSNIEFGRSISLIYHHYRRFVSEQLNQVDNFNPGWVPYLKIIGRNAGIVSEELSKRMMVSKPAITKTIHQLAEEGLCILENHPTDGRSKQIYLTEKAKLLIERINPILLETQTKVLKGLSVEETRKLNSIFDKILSNITS